MRLYIFVYIYIYIPRLIWSWCMSTFITVNFFYLHLNTIETLMFMSRLMVKYVYKHYFRRMKEREKVHHEAYCISATSIVIIGKCLIEYTEKCERKNQRVIWKHRKRAWDKERDFQTQRNPKYPHGRESHNTHTDIFMGMIANWNRYKSNYFS